MYRYSIPALLELLVKHKMIPNTKAVIDFWEITLNACPKLRSAHDLAMMYKAIGSEWVDR